MQEQIRQLTPVIEYKVNLCISEAILPARLNRSDKPSHSNWNYNGFIYIIGYIALMGKPGEIILILIMHFPLNLTVKA